MRSRTKYGRRVGAAASIAALALTVTACSGQPDPGDTSDTGDNPPPSEDAEAGGDPISVLLFAGPYATVAEQNLADFEAEYGIDVELTILGGEVINQKTSTELLGGGTAFDVMSIRGDSMPFYGTSDALLDMTDFLANEELTPESYGLDDITPLMLDYYSWEDAQIGLPWIADAYVLYYRTDLFEAAGLDGPPESAAEYAEYAAKLHNPPTVFGTGVTMQRSHNLSSEFYQWLSVFGGAVVDSDGQPVFDSPEAREALDFYVSLKDSAPPDAANWAFERLTTGLSQGEVAMGVQWASVASVMEDPASSKVVGKMAWAPMPKEPVPASVVGGWGLSIPAASEQPEEAFTFITWMTGPEMAREIAVLGGGPARASLLNDEGLNEKFPWFKVQGASLEQAVARPRTPGWPEIDDTMSTELSQVIVGSLEPEAAIEHIAAKVEEATQ